MVTWQLPPECPPELPPRPHKGPSHLPTATPPHPHPRSHPISIHTAAIRKPVPSILRTKHPLPSLIHHSAENISTYGHNPSEVRCREQTITRLEAQIGSNRAPACWVKSIGAGMTEEVVRRRREVYRSKDVLEVECGINNLGLAQWAWECEVGAKEAKERRERVMRERELEDEENSEVEEGGTGRRVVWKGEGKGKEKECDDSFKQKWRDLMARMDKEEGGKEAVGMGGGFSVW